MRHGWPLVASIGAGVLAVVLTPAIWLGGGSSLPSDAQIETAAYDVLAHRNASLAELPTPDAGALVDGGQVSGVRMDVRARAAEERVIAGMLRRQAANEADGLQYVSFSTAIEVRSVERSGSRVRAIVAETTELVRAPSMPPDTPMTGSSTVWTLTLQPGDPWLLLSVESAAEGAPPMVDG